MYARLSEKEATIATAESTRYSRVQRDGRSLTQRYCFFCAIVAFVVFVPEACD